MGMRIRTNVSSLTAQRYLANNYENLNKTLESLSSGYRINKSADDAAGLAVSENLRGKIRGINVAKRNANDAISMVQIAEGSMNEMTNILIRMRELTTQAASDTFGETERSYLNREYVQLVDEIDRIADTTEYNGNRFFRPGDNTEYVVQVGTNDNETDTIRINLEGLAFDTESLGLGKEAEIGGVDGSGPERNDIAAKLSVVDEALGRISSERATLGSVQSRLNSTIQNLSVGAENMNQARSRIVDVDFASETAELTKGKILLNSNTSVLMQANQSPELALSLLR